MKRPPLLVLSILFVLLALVSASKNQNTKDVAGVSTSPIRGVIIPHHDLAKVLIGDTLKRIKDEGDYSRIVIIGPNHYHPDAIGVTTALEVADFPIDLAAAQKFTSKFSDTLVSQEITQGEHSIMIPMVFLDEYFPISSYLPLIFSTNYAPRDIDAKAEYLASLGDDTLFIAAVDFSHESMLEAALAKNQESIEAIKAFDYQKIYSFEDDHLDSPVSIVVFLKVMERLNTINWETWHTSHGALLLDDPSLRGTSYVLGVFR